MALIDWVTLGGFIVVAVILLVGVLRWEHEREQDNVEACPGREEFDGIRSGQSLEKQSERNRRDQTTQ